MLQPFASMSFLQNLLARHRTRDRLPAQERCRNIRHGEDGSLACAMAIVGANPNKTIVLQRRCTSDSSHLAWASAGAVMPSAQLSGSNTSDAQWREGSVHDGALAFIRTKNHARACSRCYAHSRRGRDVLLLSALHSRREPSDEPDLGSGWRPRSRISRVVSTSSRSLTRRPIEKSEVIPPDYLDIADGDDPNLP